MLFFVIFEVILRITFKYTFKLEPVDFSIPISRTDENTTSGLSFPPSSLPDCLPKIYVRKSKHCPEISITPGKLKMTT